MISPIKLLIGKSMSRTIYFLLSFFLIKVLLALIVMIFIGFMIKISYGIPKSDIPNLDKTSTLEGIDADVNGIRDDIDRYIANTYPAPEQKKAVNQYARNLQDALLVDKTNKEDLKSYQLESSRSITCIFEKIPRDMLPVNSDVIQDILAATINTKLRRVEFKKLNQALDGTSISLQTEDFCNN